MEQLGHAEGDIKTPERPVLLHRLEKGGTMYLFALGLKLNIFSKNDLYSTRP